jgi:hypothetical protein
MKRIAFLFLLAILLIPLFTSRISPIDLKSGSYPAITPDPNEFAVNINLLGEKGELYRSGEEIRLSFQTTKDAYVIVYDLDAEGNVQLLYPEDGHPVASVGRMMFFLPVPGKNVHWTAGGTTGVEYIHAVAVTDRSRINEDELYFLARNDRLSDEKRFCVDLDPYLAFNMIDEELVSGAENAPPATDFTYFYINKRVEYPRYLCSKCHSPQKLPDPYAMECPEVVIEKISYDEEPHYPYPPLYAVTHSGEESDENSFTSDRYGDSLLDEDADRAGDTEEDTHLYLSIYSGYPWFRSYYPYCGINLIGFDPFYWDVWWGSGWWGIGGFYWWPGCGWWYPPSSYWAYHYPYPGWGHGDGWGWNRHDRNWAGGGPEHRPLYGGRTIAKRYIDYTRTATETNRNRAIAGSRLIKTRNSEVAGRIERTNLERRTTGNNLVRTAIRDNQRAATIRESKRTVVHGVDRVNRSAGGAVIRTSRWKSIDRTHQSDRAVERRSIQRTREESAGGRSSGAKRDVIRGSAPQRKSSRSGRNDSTSRGSSISPTNRESGNAGPGSDAARPTSRGTSQAPAPARTTSAPAGAAKSPTRR